MLKAPELELEPELSPQEQLIALHQMGFTEEAIAHGLNISQSTVSRLMRGQTSPRIGLAQKIDEIFLRYSYPTTE